MLDFKFSYLCIQLCFVLLIVIRTLYQTKFKAHKFMGLLLNSIMIIDNQSQSLQ